MMLARSSHRFASLVLLSSVCAVRLLPPGTSRIVVTGPVEGPGCGFMPVGEPSVVSTSGLRWDVQDRLMAFGGLVSTAPLHPLWPFTPSPCRV